MNHNLIIYFFRIERKALEKATAAALEKATSLKRKSDAEALAALPKIKKK